jgi:hypothetical protein
MHKLDVLKCYMLNHDLLYAEVIAAIMGQKCKKAVTFRKSSKSEMNMLKDIMIKKFGINRNSATELSTQ